MKHLTPPFAFCIAAILQNISLRKAAPYRQYWNVVFGPYLYGQSEDITRVNLQAESPELEVLVKNATGIIDGQYIYYSDLSDGFHLYRCNMDGSDPVLLLDQPVLPASLNFDDEFIFFRLLTGETIRSGPDTHDIYRFPKADLTQVEKIATLPEMAYQVLTVPGYDKVFVLTLAPLNDEGNQAYDPPVYVMGLDGSDLTQLELPDY